MRLGKRERNRTDEEERKAGIMRRREEGVGG